MFFSNTEYYFCFLRIRFINGNATRVAESNITGLIDVTANGVTLNGFLCTGSAAIKVSANQTTISYMKLDQVTPINCSSQNRKGAIADASSTTDLTVTNCYIKAKTPSSTSYEHQAQFMSLNNVTNLTFTNNYVTNVSYLSDSVMTLFSIR